MTKNAMNNIGMNLTNYYEFIFLRNISVFRDLNLGDLFTISPYILKICSVWCLLVCVVCVCVVCVSE